jgi:transposase
VCAALVVSKGGPAEQRATLLVLRSTAERLLTAEQQAGELEREIRKLLDAMAPLLLAEPGVGPFAATQVLLAWSHPGRVRSDAAFAMLCGAAPLPASSGRTVRHRLNRGGDRQLNRALHTIAVCRERHYEPTKRYVARRIAEGKTIREIRRCLKRAIARRLYRLLEHNSRPLGWEAVGDARAAAGTAGPRCRAGRAGRWHDAAAPRGDGRRGGSDRVR